jgi:hypothetical protein
VPVVSRTLEALAAEHGILPVGKGYGPCPCCGAKLRGSGTKRRGKSDSRGALWIGRGKGGHDAWHCHACGKGGGARALLAALGARVEGPLNLTPRPAIAAKVDVRAGFEALRAIAGHWRDDVVGWARDVRGWGDLAGAVVDLPDVAWTALTPAARRALSADGRRLVGVAFKNGWPLLVAQWAGDAVHTAERRWAQPTMAPFGRKTLALKTDDVGDRDAPRSFGSPEAAMRALVAGKTVVLVEGGPDYLVARAAGLVALGAASCGELPGLAACMVSRLPHGARGDVVCIAHRGDPGDVGAAKMREAAASMAGTVGVRWADLGPMVGDRGDLADAVRLAVRDGRSGRAAVVGIVEGAARLSEAPAPPVALADAAERIRAELADPPDVGTLRVLAFPMGAGKTRVAAMVAAEMAADGRRVVFATPNHKLAAELGDAVREAGGEVEHLRGLMAEGDDGAPACRARRDAMGEARVAIDAALAASGRRVCRGCPHREECPLAQAPTVRPGVVTVAPWALVRAGMTIPAGTLLIADDCGADVEVVERTAAELTRLADVRAMPDAQRAAAVALARMVGTLAEPMPEGVREVAVCGAALAERLRAVGEVVTVARAAEMMGRHPEDLPDPSPAVVLTAAHTIGGVTVESRGPAAEREARAVVLVAAAMAAGVTPHHGAALELVCRAGGAHAWRIVRPPPALPDGVHVIALDGTAWRRPETWRAAARSMGRTLDLRTVRVVPPRTVPAHQRLAGGLDAGALYRPMPDGRRVWTEGAPGALRAALLELSAEMIRAGVPPGGRVGVLTLMTLARAVRGESCGVEGAAVAAELRAVWQAWCAEVEGVDVEGVPDDGAAVETGHYGADDRGHNRWQDCAVVALLGTPRAPVDVWRACARVHLGADAEAPAVDALARALSRERVAETVAQGVARGRHLRSPALRLVYVCASEEIADGADLPGLVWTRRRAGPGDGAPPTPTGTTPAAAMAAGVERGRRVVAAEAHADDWGAVSAQGLVGLGLKVDAARRLAERIGQARQWRLDTAAGHGIWAADVGNRAKYAESLVKRGVPPGIQPAVDVPYRDTAFDVENQVLRGFVPVCDSPPTITPADVVRLRAALARAEYASHGCDGPEVDAARVALEDALAAGAAEPAPADDGRWPWEVEADALVAAAQSDDALAAVLVESGDAPPADALWWPAAEMRRAGATRAADAALTTPEGRAALGYLSGLLGDAESPDGALALAYLASVAAMTGGPPTMAAALAYRYGPERAAYQRAVAEWNIHAAIHGRCACERYAIEERLRPLRPCRAAMAG